MVSSGSARRIRRLVVGGAAAVLLGSAGASVAHAAGFLGLSPDAGAPGTPYKVTVTCDQEPTLYGQPLDGDPAGTLVPLSIAPDGATEWTYDATAGQYDDQYGANCGDDTAQARFDADSPQLLLGPLAENVSQTGGPKTEVLGTDCPAGTTASVTITLDGATTTQTATIDERGDWTVPLPAPYVVYGSKQALRVEASCGSVTYAPLIRAAILLPPPVTGPTTLQTSPSTSRTAPGTSIRPAPAVPAHARSATASYTG